MNTNYLFEAVDADSWADVDWNYYDPKVKRVLEKGKELGYEMRGDEEFIYLSKDYNGIEIAISNETATGAIADRLILELGLSDLSNDYYSVEQIDEICKAAHEACEIGKKDLEELLNLNK